MGIIRNFVRSVREDRYTNFGGQPVAAGKSYTHLISLSVTQLLLGVDEILKLLLDERCPEAFPSLLFRL